MESSARARTNIVINYRSKRVLGTRIGANFTVLGSESYRGGHSSGSIFLWKSDNKVLARVGRGMAAAVGLACTAAVSSTYSYTASS